MYAHRRCCHLALTTVFYHNLVEEAKGRMGPEELEQEGGALPVWVVRD